ncbi:PREDICTED: homeobox protein Wariai-like [Amphimedon queenslandica]|nr:PREDICTED: homeobox protein Wariai-like [Amphimedon queenslandica]|eukprot:XP_019859829.1 PREDICTED: homeobox protein Wariai-like [Amphimedon queenslandica]
MAPCFIELLIVNLDQLHKACKNGNSGDVNTLLYTTGVDIDAPDNDGHTPLHHACEVGSERIVKLLIQEKANCCKRDNKMRTPLHIACLRGHHEVANTILSLCNKKDIRKMLNAVDCNGYTPLHTAGNERIVKLLLEKEADVTKCDNKGLNPLEVAVEEGHE